MSSAPANGTNFQPPNKTKYRRDLTCAQLDGSSEDLYDVKFSPSRRRMVIQPSTPQSCDTCGASQPTSAHSSNTLCDHSSAPLSSLSSRSVGNHSVTNKENFRQLVQHNLKTTDEMPEPLSYGPLDPAKFSPPPERVSHTHSSVSSNP